MRPTSRRVLIAAAMGLTIMAVAWTLVVPAVLKQIAHRVVRLSDASVALVAGTAHAEDMKFEPVPAESVTRSERRRARSSSSSTVAPVPAVPAPPPTPSVPDARGVVIGKSGDIMRVGSDVNIGPDEEVTGDVLAVGGALTIEGHVNGNAVAMGGDIFLKTGARVDGDVVCMGGELHEEAGVTVGGKRVVGLGGKGFRGRTFRGDLDFDEGDRPRRRGGSLPGALSWLLIWLLVGWAIVKVAPGRTAAAVEGFRRGPGSAFLVGWLALVLTVPALIAVVLLTALLCITIIGIPLGIAVLFGYFLFLAVFCVWGGAVGAAMIGERFAQRQGFASPTLMRSMITGVIGLAGAMFAAQVLRALDVIPGFGALGQFFWVILLIANILIGVAGWGALLYSEFTTGLFARIWNGRRPNPPAAPAPPEPPVSPAAAVTTVDVPPPPPPAPPAPPSSYMPPQEPPPSTPSGS